MTIRELLNDRKWHHQDLDRIRIVVRNRGSVNDESVVSGADIAEIRNDGLSLNDDETFIPYHRVLRVLIGGETLFERDSSNIDAPKPVL